VQRELPLWLGQWKFSRYVTLAFNDESAGAATLPGSSLGQRFLFERLRKWDAHINHLLLGKHWAERDADRTFVFFVLEKAEYNPHWHGLIRFFSDDPGEILRQERLFVYYSRQFWV
jgi:hypothetical protein